MAISFVIRVFLRLLVISVSGSATILIIWLTPFFLASIWTGLLAILLFIELLRFINAEHREMRYFMEAIEQNDFSARIGNTRMIPKTQELKKFYGSVMSTFRRLRSEKESQHQFLQTLVEQVRVAILCFDEAEKVVLVNEAAKSLFGKPYWYKLDALEKMDPSLLALIRSLPSGSRETFTLNQEGISRRLTLQATEFKLLEVPHKLITLQDISRELDEQEVSTWQKLIRVLTHEINNSVIPIATLSELSLGLLKGATPEAGIDREDLEDLRGNLHIIAGRSQGLARFVEEYKHLNSLSPLSMLQFKVTDLLDRTFTLLNPKMEERGIDFGVELEIPELELWADLEKIEQVLINLLNNAIEAVEEVEHPQVSLGAYQDNRGQVVLQVRDNGKGIPAEIKDKIFTPFYTTRKAGSGIGLSLGRQIMSLHKGALTVESIPGKGTTFNVVFDGVPIGTRQKPS